MTMVRTARSGLAVMIGLLALAPVGHAQWFSRKRTDSTTVSPNLKNSLAPYVTTPPDVVDRMLELAKPKAGETLYDLGCGDGRILITAAQKYGAKAVGIELSEKLVKQARQNISGLHLEALASVQHGDIMQTDISGADIVTLYLTTTANETLRPVLERSLKPNTRVVSYDYPIPGWKAIDEIQRRVNNQSHPIYLYQIPASFKQ